MKRLQHTTDGFIRSLQISRHSLFGIVEGKDTDSFFYGTLLGQVSKKVNLTYQIKRARELPAQAGGKPALVSFYKYLRAQKKLVMTTRGKPTIVIFFLDKDVDDLLHNKIRSSHVIYTKYYDVQNYLFVHGDIVKALSAAGSVDEQELKEAALLQGNWCLWAAQRWKEWIVLCLLCQLHQVRIANYSVVSRINRPLNGNADANLKAAAIEDIRQQLGWTTSKMQHELSRIEKTVNKLFRKGLHDVVFKGKWYAIILEHDFRDAFNGQDLAFSGVADRIKVTLPMTMNFTKTWASDFTRPIEKIVLKAMSNSQGRLG